MSVNTKVNGQLVKSAGLYSVTKPIGMADIYSTEEKEVGLWIDNKPLYQKSFYVDSLPSSAGTKTIATGLTNIDMCKITDGWSKGFGGLNIVRCESANAITYGVGCWVAVTNNVPTITIEVGRDRSSIDAWVTLQYTKTTDTPWSGKFVPQGYGYVSSGDIYSLEERQVGVWTDGKPLYQKTFIHEGTYTGTNTNLSISIPNAETAFIVNCWAINSNGANFNLSYAYPDNATNNVTAFITSDKEYLGIRVGSNQTIKKLVTTIRYTKTTDVAGSGEYVPSGDKAVHYSTDEEVIGTFMGETLYRKSFTTTQALTVSNSTWTDTGFTITNGGIAVNAFSVRNTDTGQTFPIIAYIENGSLKIEVCWSSQLAFPAGSIITIEYTKTS